MEWEHYFREHILSRGFEYYVDGAVEDLEVSEDRITATVYGTEEYDVEIRLHDGEVEDMYCSCPYAESGQYCKHMAAVLYEWEEAVDEDGEWGEDCPDEDDQGDIGENSRKSPGKNDEIGRLVEQADENAVRRFLTDILRADEKLLSRFKALVSPKISREDIDRYKGLVDRTVSRYEGRGGFIGYSEAYGFIREMDGYLAEDVKMMLERGSLWEAFELSCYIFMQVAEVEMDDSDRGQAEIGENCREVWDEILNEADEKIKQDMYYWFISHLDGSIVDYMEECIEDFVMGNFQEEKYLRAKLDFTEEKARKAKGDSDSWSSDYHAQKWVMYHIGLMEELEYDHESIYGYCKENWKYAGVRRYYASWCMDRKDYDQAISVLKESLTIDVSKPGLVKDFGRMLKDIYRTVGREEEYKAQLWKMVTELDAGNMEEFRELRGLYPKEEWENVREKIFASRLPYGRLGKLYQEEKMYDRLLSLVVSSQGLYTLQEYEKDLKDLYPQEILSKYTDEVMAMARRAADRKRYQEWVGILRRMKKLKGGTAQVQKIVEQWKSLYANRPAMMEELRKLYAGS